MRENGELEYADKNRKLPCVSRYWRYSSLLLNKTHAQIKRIRSENPRRHLYSMDYEKKAAMENFMH